MQQKKRGMLLSKDLLNKESRLKDEIEKLSLRKEQLFDELKREENLRRAIQAEIDELNVKIAQLKSERSALESKIEEARRFLDSIKLKLSEKRSEMNEIYAKASDVEEELEKVKKELQMLHNRYFPSDIWLRREIMRVLNDKS